MFLLLVFVAILLFILYLKYHFSYWRRRGFPEIAAVIPFGNMLPFFRRQQSCGDTLADLYWKTSEPVVGIYNFLEPQLMVRDLSLVKSVMMEDFDQFYNRNMFINEKDDPLSVNLFSQQGEKWKKLRQILTPLFTAAKFRVMFPTFMTEVNKLDTFLAKSFKKNEPVELRENVVAYVLNVVGSILFGLEVDILEDRDHVLRKMFGYSLEPDNLVDMARQSMVFHLPS